MLLFIFRLRSRFDRHPARLTVASITGNCASICLAFVDRRSIESPEMSADRYRLSDPVFVPINLYSLFFVPFPTGA